MTTYMQEEYEALALEERPIITDVKVNSTITNHPDELTDKELEKVTSVFSSIYPRVGENNNLTKSYIELAGSAQSYEDAWPESLRAGDGGHP